MTSDTKLINQGAYGCVFRPSITCDGVIEEETNYITKIQNKESASLKETEIGNQIKKIENYSEYFAPIVESCPVKIASINSDEVGKCDFIKNTRITRDTEYESNKIKYVGKNTLASYLFSVLKNSPNNFVEKMLETYSTLLDSIDLLNNQNITHMDLKENNIMCRDIDDKPIIIDFGLSFDRKILQDERYDEVFFTYSADYDVWCVDITFMSYIVNELNHEWYRSKVEDAHIEEITKDFSSNEEKKQKIVGFLNLYKDKYWHELINELKKNNNTWDSEVKLIIYKVYGHEWKNRKVKDYVLFEIINDFFQSNKIFARDRTKEILIDIKKKDEFKKSIEKYYVRFIGKTWGELVNNLLTKMDTWDNYSLAVIYTNIIKDFNLNKYEEISPLIKEFKELLLSIVLSLPAERMSIADTKSRLLEISQNVSRKDIMDTNKSLKNESVDRIKQNITVSKIKATKEEKKIYSKRVVRPDAEQ
jgi:serine/threonine protein kinase